MATRYWKGGAPAVAQVSTGSIDTYDAASTYTVTIGGVAISETGDTDVATTATNLRASLNASTHPYFSAVTWSGSSGNITGTSDNAGVAFVAALTVSGGTGTVTDFSTTTANAGPNSWGTAANWDAATAPVNSDTVIFSNSAINCVDGLSTGLTGITLVVDASYTGYIGIPRNRFFTSSDGLTYVTTAAEYRAHALSIGATSIDIGKPSAGSASGGGSPCIKIDNTDTGNNQLRVQKTSATPADGYASMHYHVSSTTGDVEVQDGIVAINDDTPGRTAQIDIAMTQLPSSKLTIGASTTTDDVEVNAGTVYLDASGTVTNVNQYGGSLFLQHEDLLVTNLKLYSGTCYYLAGDVTTCTVDGGTFDGGQGGSVKTVTTTVLNKGRVIAGTRMIFSAVTFSGFPTKGITVTEHANPPNLVA